MAESSLAYDFDYFYFDDNDYSAFEPRSNTAPVYEPYKKKKTQSAPVRKKVKEPVKKQTVRHKGKKLEKVRVYLEGNPTAKEKNLAKMSALRICAFLGVGSVLLGFIGVNIGMRATIDTVSRENARFEKNIAIANSESVRLNTELDAMFSPDKIEDYAVNVLGMVKLEDYKVKYFDFTNEDKVIISGNKEYK